MMERRQPTIVELIMIALVAGAVGIAAGYWTRKSLAEAKIASAEEAARKILDDAQHQADAKKKESAEKECGAERKKRADPRPAPNGIV